MKMNQVMFYVSLNFCLVYIISGWFFGGNSNTKKDISSNEKIDAIDLIKNKPVSFEIKSVDENFLAQAKFENQLSPLDLCHHSVVYELKQSCSDLSEENLGKFAVKLFNCQAEAERRPTFICLDDMRLSECTENMDSTTWNGYQIVSNRARAICYSTKQQQFRMKTEYTVNNLLKTTEGQVSSMKMLKEGQQFLVEQTEHTLQRMKDGQKSLIDQHLTMKQTQKNVQKQISSNIKDLTREKALIATGNREIMKLTEKLHKKLDYFSNELFNVNENHKLNQLEIVDTLAVIKQEANEIWKKFDENNRQLVEINEKSLAYYSDTLENLKLINDSVFHIVTIIAHFQGSVDSKLDWLTTFIGFTGTKLQFFYICSLNIILTIGLLILRSLLDLPMYVFFIMISILFTKAYMEIIYDFSLNYQYVIAILLLLVTLVAIKRFIKKLLFGQKINKPKQSLQMNAIETCKENQIEQLVKQLEELSQNDPSSIEPILRKYSYASSTSIKSVVDYHCDPPNTPITPRTPNNIHTPSSVFSQRIMTSPAIERIKTNLNGSFSKSPTKRRHSLGSPKPRTPTRPLCCGIAASSKLPCKKTSAVGSEFCLQHMSQAIPSLSPGRSSVSVSIVNDQFDEQLENQNNL